MENISLLTFFLSAPLRLKLRIGACLGLALAAITASGIAIRDVWLIHAGYIVKHVERRFVPEVIEPFQIVYEMKDASVSLTSAKKLTSASAQFTLVLDCPSEEAKHLMEMNRAKLRDLIFEAATQFTLEDFKNADGFTAFKSALRKTLVEKFASRAPRDVALRDWVVN